MDGDIILTIDGRRCVWNPRAMRTAEIAFALRLFRQQPEAWDALAIRRFAVCLARGAGIGEIRQAVREVLGIDFAQDLGLLSVVVGLWDAMRTVLNERRAACCSRP